jgi:GNAT superfamily N-acetyltransferase
VDLRIIDVDPLGDVALSLLREAAVEVRALYADVLPPDRPWPVNARPGPRDVYVVAYRGQHPVASGALRRMFVLREHRRNRISHAVLTHLVAEARRLGYERIRLETGNKQVAAIALYEGFGFRRIAPFRPFDDDPTSVCFELAIVHV